MSQAPSTRSHRTAADVRDVERDEGTATPCERPGLIVPAVLS